VKSEAITVATTATHIAGPGTALNPNNLLVYVPTGGATVYFGGADVSTSNGLPIPAGAYMAWEPVSSPIYAVVASSTQEVRVGKRGE
jgi:hypothetical protein